MASTFDAIVMILDPPKSIFLAGVDVHDACAATPLSKIGVVVGDAIAEGWRRVMSPLDRLASCWPSFGANGVLWRDVAIRVAITRRC